MLWYSGNGGVKMSEDTETPERRRERLKHEEVKRKPHREYERCI